MDKFWVTITLATNAFSRYTKWIQYSGVSYTQYENELLELAKEGEN